MSRVLVTGAAGFIGSHVATHCLAQGDSVVAVDNLSGGPRDNIPPMAEFVHADLRDPLAVSRLWMQGPFDVVYHLAAFAAEGLSHFVRRFNYENNLLASIHLINEAIRHHTPLIVFTSSIAVYGASPPPFRESLAPCPIDPYGIAKHAVELDLQSAHDVFGLDSIVIRPHNVYGERQNLCDPYRNVVGIFVQRLLQDRPLPIFGDGLQTRAFTHIDDVAPLITRAASVPSARNQTFNLGSDASCTILELAALLSDAFDKPLRIESLPPRHEVVHAIPDHTKARQFLANSSPPIPLRKGIDRLARWVRDRPTGYPPGSVPLEIERELPVSWRMPPA